MPTPSFVGKKAAIKTNAFQGRLYHAMWRQQIGERPSRHAMVEPMEEEGLF
jgi:hypothetical protein